MLQKAVKKRGWTLRRGRKSVGQSPENIPRWDEEHMASSETGKRVWRKEEKEVSGKKKKKGGRGVGIHV